MAIGASARALVDLNEACDEELVERYQAGDGLAVEVLLDRYRKFAHMKVHSYFLVGGNRDDIVQEGMIGLYKAIRDYRPDRGASFRTFADVCITRQIVTAIKTATRHKHEPLNTGISLSRPIADDDGQERVLVDVLVTAYMEDPADVVIRDEEISAIKRAFAEVLSDFEAHVLQLYIDGKSYQQIGKLLSRRVKSIDNALQRIKRKLELSVREPVEV